MRKEDDFLIYCMERYRYYKNLSGKDVAKLLKSMVFIAILNNILSLCILWGTIISFRILMIISETQTGYTAGKQTRDEMGMGQCFVITLKLQLFLRHPFHHFL